MFCDFWGWNLHGGFMVYKLCEGINNFVLDINVKGLICIPELLQSF